MIMVTNNTKELDIQIYNILKELGADPSILGYKYTFWLVHNIAEGKFDVSDKLMFLYEQTAKHFNTTAMAVERCIRHMIIKIFNTVSMDITYKYFGNTIPYGKNRVMGGQFIASIVEYVRIHGDIE